MEKLLTNCNQLVDAKADHRNPPLGEPFERQATNHVMESNTGDQENGVGGGMRNHFDQCPRCGSGSAESKKPGGSEASQRGAADPATQFGARCSSIHGKVAGVTWQEFPAAVAPIGAWGIAGNQSFVSAFTWCIERYPSIDAPFRNLAWSIDPASIS